MGTQLLHRCPQALAPRRHAALMELLWTSLCPSGRHGRRVSVERAVRGNNKGSLALINTSDSALPLLWVFKLLNLSF